MHNLSNKAQFFIVTAVVFSGIFYIMGKYLASYNFIDTSQFGDSTEIFLFNNIRDKAIKTVKITKEKNPSQLTNNLLIYRNYAEMVARDNGYVLFFEFDVKTYEVSFNMTLSSERMTLNSTFSVPI